MERTGQHPVPSAIKVLIAVLVAAAAHPIAQTASKNATVIPFELKSRHIVVKVTIGTSRPLAFILDTGADAALVRTEVAQELGLKLEGTVGIGGAGGGRQSGQFVRNASWSLVGLRGFTQPVALAIPMTELSSAMGMSIDGIIGGQFIRQFVVELDYQARQLTLHDRKTFKYDGTGDVLPIEMYQGHPVITATVTAVNGAPQTRKFVLDIGSGGSLILHSPFVREQSLPDANMPTLPVIGAAGAGGRTNGRIGRVASLEIGRFKFDQPFTMFSEDSAGAFANSVLAGNIGAQIASRFRLFFDYERLQLILEPSSTFGDKFDRAFSGLALRAVAPDYRVIRVEETMEHSAATASGIDVGDVVTAIDGKSADQLTLPVINEMLERAVTYQLTIRRGSETITKSLTPRKMI